MIKLRTEVDLPPFKTKMGYRHHTVMMGSCFTENIGNWLQKLCFPVTVNPFGILYNPASVANSLNLLISGKVFSGQDLFFFNGLYNSFSHHSRFSHPDSQTALSMINAEARRAADDLTKCKHLFITLGTAWVFKHRTLGEVVSNCHKLPASTFERYRLSVNEIVALWTDKIDKLLVMNPDLHVIFTVSPIRHLKDGAHENQLSKSTLLLSVDAIISHYGNKVISYFPSYELLLDELRDYRFYAPDMTHLNETALEFIREKFAGSVIDAEALSISAELEKMLPALEHRPFNKNEPGYGIFIEKQLEKINNIQNKYPFVDMKMLIEKFCEKRADYISG